MTRFSSSAPLNPGVALATILTSKSGATLTRDKYRRRTSSRPFTSGSGTVTCEKDNDDDDDDNDDATRYGLNNEALEQLESALEPLLYDITE